MSIHANTANAVINLRVTKDTKRGYGGKIKNIILFLLTNNFANYVNENSSEICRPLSYEAVMELFGWLSTNTDLPKGAKKKSKVVHPSPHTTINEADVVIDELDEEEDADENNNGTDIQRNVFSGFGDSNENEVDLTTVTISASCMQGNKHNYMMCFISLT